MDTIGATDHLRGAFPWLLLVEISGKRRIHRARLLLPSNCNGIKPLMRLCAHNWLPSENCPRALSPSTNLPLRDSRYSRSLVAPKKTFASTLRTPATACRPAGVLKIACESFGRLRRYPEIFALAIFSDTTVLRVAAHWQKRLVARLQQGCRICIS